MTPNEFVMWLKGFSEAANNFTLTPKQWDDIKDRLNQVVIEESMKYNKYNVDNTWSSSNTNKIINTNNTILND